MGLQMSSERRKGKRAECVEVWLTAASWVPGDRAIVEIHLRINSKMAAAAPKMETLKSQL